MMLDIHVSAMEALSRGIEGYQLYGNSPLTSVAGGIAKKVQAPWL